MPQHLISVDEACAMLEVTGASKDVVRRFATQAGAVLAARPALGDDHVLVTSVYGARTKAAGVNLQVGAARLQMDVRAARKIALDILGATEAAISDVAVLTLLRDRLGVVRDDVIGKLLLDLREIRQGSREAVFEQ